MRTRAKDPVSGSYETFKNGQHYSMQDFEAFSDILSDMPRKPGPMVRKQFTKPMSVLHRHGDFESKGYGLVGTYVDPELSFRDNCEPYIDSFDWSELPTSNDFDALTAIAEFDDTIAMFGSKLKQSASYGGYKWGWTPLMNDISALNNTANRVKNSTLMGDRRFYPYNKTSGFSIKKTYRNWNGTYDIEHSWDVKVKFRGIIEYNNDILSFYDFVGFHPSPKLLWDLTPFSFAIDWVLPIGDMLAAITPQRGWTKAANFTGWRVVTANLVENMKQSESSWLDHAYSNTGFKYVRRDHLYGSALNTKQIPKKIELLKVPTISQAFDIGYLANTFAKGRKRP